MSTKSIPQEVRWQVDAIVDVFNEQVIRDPNCFYSTRYRGSYLYLARSNYGMVSPICRLQYGGRLDDWTFAIFKYSSERYDPEEWFFPGSGHVNGTIEGAMRGGLEVYP